MSMADNMNPYDGPRNQITGVDLGTSESVTRVTFHSDESTETFTLDDLGIDPSGMTPDELIDAIQSEFLDWVVESANAGWGMA